MKKIIFIILITSILSITNAVTDEMNCAQFEKISAKYLECKATLLKKKTKELKLKATVGAEDLKEKVTKNANDGKKKFDKSTLKEKLIKFKNSKTLKQFMEK
jgi:hypothetical protein